MAHAPEPPFAHDRTPRIGVLLTNLGTPDAPTPSAVRRYLAQFLSRPARHRDSAGAVEAAPATASILYTRPAHRRRSTRRSGPRTARRCSCTASSSKALLLGLPRPAAQGGRISRRPVPGRARHALRQSGCRPAHRQAARGALREDPRAAAVPAIRGEHDGVGVRRGRRAFHACAAASRTALRRDVPRRRRATSRRSRRTSTTTG